MYQHNTEDLYTVLKRKKMYRCCIGGLKSLGFILGGSLNRERQVREGVNVCSLSSHFAPLCSRSLFFSHYRGDSLGSCHYVRCLMGKEGGCQVQTAMMGNGEGIQSRELKVKGKEVMVRERE